jgi:3-keto-5-aminohexanoate cleavage enzyme
MARPGGPHRRADNGHDGKVVITCAVSGAETRREQNPALPLTPEELAEDVLAVGGAGAAVVHLHVRDASGNPTQDIEMFREAIRLIRLKTDLIVEVTTGGAVGMTLEERLSPLALEGADRPEMASLDCGTVNFGDDYIINTMPMIRQAAAAMRDAGVRPTLECFDLSHIDAAHLLIDEGLIDPPFHFGLVLGVPGAVKYDEVTLDFLVGRLPPGALWTGIGIGKSCEPVVARAVEAGGFVRTGFEDNVYLTKGVLAESNAQLVARAVEVVRGAGLEPATPAEARAIFAI